MSSLNTKHKKPFAVSLVLIFCYCLLLAVVPTDPTATDAITATPSQDTLASSADEQVVNTRTSNVSVNEPAVSIH